MLMRILKKNKAQTSLEIELSHVPIDLSAIESKYSVSIRESFYDSSASCYIYKISISQTSSISPVYALITILVYLNSTLSIEFYDNEFYDDE